MLEGDDLRLLAPWAEEVNAAQHGQGSPLGGHDAINRMILVKARAKRLGVYGKCPHCKGRGEHKFTRKKKIRRLRNWKEFEPPRGKGWQLWETCSEGSPISPVFRTAEELADWCMVNATIFADQKVSRSTWLTMFIGKKNLETGSLLGVDFQGRCSALATLEEQQEA